MTLRIGPGPVFVYECLTLARRWQMYAARVAFVLILLITLLVVWVVSEQERAMRGAAGIRAQADVGVNFYYGIIGTELALVLLAAPAMTAGAICIDKARGGLIHMLVTDLSNAEIVLGKLLSRLVPVLGLVACGLPVMYLATLLGGIDTEALLGAFLIMVGVAVFTCALALLLSIWGHKTHEVLLATYLILIITLIIQPAWMAIDAVMSVNTQPTWLIKANPFFMAFAVYNQPAWYTYSSGHSFLGDAAIYLGAALVASLLLVLLSVLSIRRVVVRHSGQPQRRGRWRLPRLRFFSPSLVWNPVAWREWHRRQPTVWSMFISLTFWLGCIAFTGLVIFTCIVNGGRGELGAFVSAFQVSIGMLLVCIYAVVSLSEERTRGSLDLLMVTPLSTWSIVWGKWQAAFRSALPLAILPTINVIVVSFAAPRGRPFPAPVGAVMLAPVMLVMVLSYGAAFTSLGLALATWIKRFGWAVAASVTIYLSITVGIFIMALSLSRGGGDVGRSIALLSPFFGPGEMTANAVGMGRNEWAGYFVVILVYAIVAVTFYLLTLVTFDGCLGRITFMVRRIRPRRPLRSSTPSLATTP